MKKKVLCLALALSVLLSLTVPSALASGGMSNFKQQYSYNNRFSDVNTTHWCHPYVKTSYEYGLINGKNSTSTYCPFDNFSVAEALKIAACIHSTYYNGSAENLTNSTSTPYWYSVYVNYCINNGIIKNGDFANYKADCTRGQMAYIFSRCLPSSELAAVRSVDIPDCSSAGTMYYTNIKTLYDAGIVSGDTTHRYYPTQSIKRSEAAKIVCTLICPSMRDSSYFSGSVEAESASGPCLVDLMDMNLNEVRTILGKEKICSGFDGWWWCTFEPGEVIAFLQKSNNVTGTEPVVYIKWYPSGNLRVSKIDSKLSFPVSFKDIKNAGIASDFSFIGIDGDSPYSAYIESENPNGVYVMYCWSDGSAPYSDPIDGVEIWN